MKGPGSISILPKKATWLHNKQSISPSEKCREIRVLLHLHQSIELGVKVFHLKLQGQV
jgi:hypothetical protein